MDFLMNPMGLPYSAKMIHGMDGAQETQNKLMNNETFMMWQLRLYELAMSVFEWVNLPSGINSRQIEWWLLRDGVAVFLQDEALAEDPLQRSPEGYAIMQVLLQGGYDIYNLPVNRVAYAVEGWNIPLTSQNSVLIFNNNFRYPTWMVLNLYAMRLAEIDRTIDTNVIGQKMPKFVKCNEPQRLTFKNIAAKIIEKGGDYVLAVKGNQKKLRDDIIWHLHSELQDRSTRELKAKGQYAVTLEKDHGRIEKRECYLSNDLSWFEGLEDWRGIAGVGWIRNTRHVDNKNDKTTTEDHYFIYSLKEAQAKDLLRIKREHWAIENNLHWMLDMAFKEDDCRARAKNAAEVMNILRKLALQMLKTCDTCKCGMRSKRKLCGLGIPTALQVLGLVPTGLLIP